MVLEMDLDAVSSFTGVLFKLADAVSVPRDQMVYAFCLFLAFSLAFLFRLLLPLDRASAAMRHLFMLFSGAALSIYCFGVLQFSILLALMLTCYFIMKYGSNKNMHIMVLVAALGGLSLTHIYNMAVSYGRYNTDFTVPLMIIVMKITGLAFALRDGRLLEMMEAYPGQYKDIRRLSSEQIQQCVRKIPNPLEYTSYLLSFVALFSGPLSSFADYNRFITGDNLPEKVRRGLERAPSPTWPVLKKFFGSLVALALNIYFTPMFQVETLWSEDFVSRIPLALQVVYLYGIGFITRCRYYFAFILADATCNAAGFGFNGYDEDGKARWDLVTHMKPFKIELATSPKTSIENWNIQTNVWLRRVCYERFPIYPRVATFLLSGIWHGFYGGILISFFFMALMTDAAGKARRFLRHRFQAKSWMRRGYDCLTWLGTCVMMIYFMCPFLIMRTRLSIQVWQSWYFFGHLLILIPLAFFPAKAKMKSRQAQQDADQKQTSEQHAHSN